MHSLNNTQLFFHYTNSEILSQWVQHQGSCLWHSGPSARQHRAEYSSSTRPVEQPRQSGRHTFLLTFNTNLSSKSMLMARYLRKGGSQARKGAQEQGKREGSDPSAVPRLPPRGHRLLQRPQGSPPGQRPRQHKPHGLARSTEKAGRIIEIHHQLGNTHFFY